MRPIGELLNLDRDRVDWVLVLAPLLVIALLGMILFSWQQNSRVEQTRAQGVGLARLLGNMPLAELLPETGEPGVLQAVRLSQDDSDLAYISVISADGVPLLEALGPGVIVPNFEIPDHPGAWLGERHLELAADQQAIFEFHAPVLEHGDLVAFVRLGYRAPRFGPDASQIPFYATLALPIFLLAPLFYFLLRREVSPVRQAIHEIGEQARSGRLERIEVSASGDLAEFIERFNHYVAQAQSRIDELEGEHQELVTTTRLLTYGKSRIESVLEAFPEAVLVLDESGAVTYVNAKLAMMMQREPEEMLHHQPQDWCDQEEVRLFLRRCTDGVKGGYVSDSLLFSPQHAPDKHVEVRTFPLFSPKKQSEILGTLVVFRDATEEVLAKRSRAEFVAHIAHELKTPLNILGMYSEQLQGPDGDDLGFRTEAYNVIHDEVDRLSSLINNLLSITHIEMSSLNVQRQRVKLGEFLTDLFTQVQRADRGDKLEFELELPQDAPTVFVDKALIRVAVMNLLTNACKYNRPGGRVTLNVDEDEDNLIIAVRDTGIGIATNDIGRVFEKFFRSDLDEVRERTGHGLGLALAHEIVRLHSGEITVQSVPGEGTEFRILLRKDATLSQPGEG